MNPYFAFIGRNGDDTSVADYIIKRGYIAVDLDVRGTNRAHGQYPLFSAQQEQDFVEVADSLAKHYPGSNGTAALAGESYLGTDVLAAGRYIRPGSPIKALFAATAGSA